MALYDHADAVARRKQLDKLAARFADYEDESARKLAMLADALPTNGDREMKARKNIKYLISAWRNPCLRDGSEFGKAMSLICFLIGQLFPGK